MATASGSNPSLKKRLHSLDILRGLAVVLALYEHFGYRITFWYRGYIKPFHFTDANYSVHLPHYKNGTLLVPDALSIGFLELLTPWITHLYIMLACFNIAWRTPAEARQRLKGRLLVFLGLFVFFTFDNFVVAMSFGASLSVYPLQMWMVLFALLHIVYALWGSRGIAVVFALSFLRFVLPIEGLSQAWETWMQAHVHRDWEYNAKLEHFLGSGALGVLAGFAYRSWFSSSHLLWVATLLFVGTLAVLFYAPMGSFVAVDYFALEHSWVGGVGTTLAIFTVCLFFIFSALLIESQIRVPRVPLFYWVGFYSLFVFAWHRILFVHITLPTHEWLSALQSQPLQNTFWVCSAHVLLALALTWILQKLRVFELVALSGQPRAGKKAVRE